ncbi:MAG: tetraacyldisaccharide 4'-kinase [Planctomycetota bacterium]
MSREAPTSRRRKTTAPRRSRSRTSSFLAALLAPLSWLYARVAAARARSWANRRQRLSKPVLSVGNLTFGGTGKTPTVIALGRRFSADGKRVAILSRGYGAGDTDGNDEAKVIARHLPDLPHFQDPNRFRAGSRVQDEFDLFVLDDGFQHHPLHRDFDLVLVDATDPFGGGWCPPGGRLREPLSSLARGDAVVITRADLVSRDELGAIMREIRSRTPAPVATARFAPHCDQDLGGTRVLAACGIGNPHAFVATLESLGAIVERTRFFRDHHEYTAADAAELAASPLPVAITEKDAVKLEPLWPDGAPLLVVTIEFEFLDGGEEVRAAMESKLWR